MSSWKVGEPWEWRLSIWGGDLPASGLSRENLMLGSHGVEISSRSRYSRSRCWDKHSCAINKRRASGGIGRTVREASQGGRKSSKSAIVGQGHSLPDSGGAGGEFWSENSILGRELGFRALGPVSFAKSRRGDGHIRMIPSPAELPGQGP